MKEIVLVGGGGHCKSVIDVIEQKEDYEIAGIVDMKEAMDENIFGYKIFADDSMLPQLVKQYSNFAVTVGHLKSNNIRVRLYKTLIELGAKLPVLISANCYVSKRSRLGDGTVVFHGAIVNAGVTIGVNNIVNTNSVIEHDVVIRDHTHISTSAIVNGNCRIGSNCFVGSHAVIIQGVEIGDAIVIGANATVVKNLSEPGIYVGTPAQKIQRF